MQARNAHLADAAAIARIYNQGIASRNATFETRLRTPEEVAGWFGGRHPVIVVEDPEVVAFAAAFVYRPRECYAGIADFSIYVDQDHRRRGAGRLALSSLIDACEAAGFWKLVSRVFLDNLASRSLLASLGFREVGVYKDHARVDGVWRDALIVERLITLNI